MHKALERLWVSWLNSGLWRGFTSRGAANRFFRSNAFHRLNRRRSYFLSYYRAVRQPHLFKDVHAFCMFVGHVKSGSTLIGSLLDAHADAIIADEVNVLDYMTAGFSKEQIYHLLLKASRRDHLKGRVTARRLTPYSVSVPGQWQGRYRTLRVIGHSQAGPVTGRLLRNTELLDQLQVIMRGVDVKVIHVVRNPFDPISLMMIRGKRSFANAVQHYFSYCEVLTDLHQRLDETSLLAVRYEAFVHQPQRMLRQICDFLGLECSDAYLDDCTKILYDAPEQSRTAIDWSSSWIDVVEQKISEVPFLHGYHYESAVPAGSIKLQRTGEGI